MKVLHVYKTYFPEDFTGVPRVIDSIAQALIPHGVESHVLTLTKGPAADEPIQVDGYQVHQVQRVLQIASAPISIKAFLKFRELATAVDLVHYHFPWPIADLMWLVGGRARPAIVTYHSDIVRQRVAMPVYRPLMNYFLSRADAIVATSPNYARSSKVLRRHAASVQVVPIGLAQRPEISRTALARWRGQLGEGFFLFVGAARYYKGLEFLLKAAATSGLPVVIAGATAPELPDTPTDNVQVVGKITDDDREALLELCAATVLPSHLRSEAFGIALIEAARAGKAMISCEIGTGTSYVNSHGETGLVVPPADAGALEAAMMKLSASPALAKSYGRAARARFEGMFTRQHMSSEYLEIYRRVARSKISALDRV